MPFTGLQGYACDQIVWITRGRMVCCVACIVIQGLCGDSGDADDRTTSSTVSMTNSAYDKVVMLND